MKRYAEEPLLVTDHAELVFVFDGSAIVVTPVALISSTVNPPTILAPTLASTRAENVDTPATTSSSTSS